MRFFPSVRLRPNTSEKLSVSEFTRIACGGPLAGRHKRNRCLMDDSSPNSLLQTLGITPGITILVINPPENYEQLLGPLPRNVHFKKRLAPNLDWIHYFAASRFALTTDIIDLKRSLGRRGTLWVSWQTRSANSQEGLTEKSVKEIGEKQDLVCLTVCPLDETWSGMKFAYPPTPNVNPYI
jgi:hypothetical protein